MEIRKMMLNQRNLLRMTKLDSKTFVGCGSVDMEAEFALVLEVRWD